MKSNRICDYVDFMIFKWFDNSLAKYQKYIILYQNELFWYIIYDPVWCYLDCFQILKMIIQSKICDCVDFHIENLQSVKKQDLDNLKIHNYI